jgi:hypothetical protein
MSVDQELEARVKAAVDEYRANDPENFYQDGMLDEEEATAVAINKFRKAMEADDFNAQCASRFSQQQ